MEQNKLMFSCEDLTHSPFHLLICTHYNKYNKLPLKNYNFFSMVIVFYESIKYMIVYS